MTNPTPPVVRVKDAFVAYRGAAGPVMALRGADLTLGSAERLLVVGPNGSGKSTLLRVITGEQPVVAGTVEVGGTPLHELSSVRRRQWRARSVGFVDQYAGRGLLPERPVVDNVALQLRLTGTPHRRADQLARETLSRLGLESLLHRAVSGLSGGEAQRVAVCAAVAHGPHLVLADEPTGELDEDAARQVYELLGRIAEEGAGVILVSHDPRAVAFADRAVRIRDGRTAEQWRPGSDVVEQVPDSRGWIRIPVERAPRLDPVPPLVAEPTADGLVLRSRHPVAVDPVPTDVAPRPHPAPDRTSAPLATGADLGVSFGTRTLFSGLALSLAPGGWTAVIGASGTGKSTLLSLFAGLADSTTGTVTVGDADWAGQSRAARAEHRRRWVALLPQRPTLVEALTVRENLQLTTDVRGTPYDPDRVADLAERLGLTRLLDQPGQLLSGGERQRAALARCLITTAPVLLLDEPTSQQDESSVARVVGVLRAEVSGGRAVLAATHDPRFVAEADQTVDLAGGSAGLDQLQSTLQVGRVRGAEPQPLP